MHDDFLRLVVAMLVSRGSTGLFGVSRATKKLFFKKKMEDSSMPLCSFVLFFDRVF
jgi:hypothetical protein